MTVKLAKSAGFCFGVNRAVSCVFELLEKGVQNIKIMGELIHNPDVIEKLRVAGVKTIFDPSEAESGDVVVLRTHGVTTDCCRALEGRGVTIIDMTCPFVSKIQNMAAKSSEEGRTVLIYGHRSHPEVIGILSRCEKAYVFSSEEELLEIGESLLDKNTPVHIVSQTTMSPKGLQACILQAKKIYTNIIISDTICIATGERQEEAEELASSCDVMVVIGGANSSNTARLFELVRSICKDSYLVENASYIKADMFSKGQTVGVTAGASTPDDIIESVCKKILEVKS